MAAPTVGQYVIFTEETLSANGWRSRFLLGVSDAEETGTWFQGSECADFFESRESAAAASRRRGVEAAHSCVEPRIMSLLMMHD